MPASPTGPYTPIAVLGQGGMGVVYRARHDETGAEVALKTVRSADPSQILAIRQEIRALSALRHAGIVRIVDQGTSDDGPWYAMELLTGHTLRWAWSSEDGAGSDVSTLATMDDLDAGEAWWTTVLDTEAALPIEPATSGPRRAWKPWLPTMRRLCHALAYLHGAGLVHGDLKPANVLIRTDGQPVLLDFGLTARLGSRESATQLTRTATPIGTPAYLAPETVGGSPVDARADLYALGCMLYELIAGEPPFVGQPSSVMLAHVREDPVPLARRAPDTPAYMTELVDGLLHKDPRARIGHALRVAALLGDAADPAEPPPPSVLFRPRLVGRTAPLTGLVDRLHQAAAGHGSAVALSGPPGSGKTRMAMELAARAKARSVRVIAGECAPISAPANEALSAFHQVLATAARLADHEGLATAEELFGRWLGLLARTAPALQSVPGFDRAPPMDDLPPELGRRALVDALEHVVAALCRRPLLLIVDDAHWADAITAAVLQRLSARASELSLQLVVTVRPEQIQASIEPIFDAFDRVEVDALATDAVGEMVGEMLALPEPPAALVDAVRRIADGSPFLVGEAVRSAVQSGALHLDRQGRWRIEPNLAQLPRDPLELVNGRLDALSADAGAVLSATAVLGASAGDETIASVTGMSPDRILDAAHALEVAGLLAPASGTALAFTHATIGEVAYGRLEAVEARRLHGNAARALSSLPDPSPREVARHWHRAGDLDRARPLYREAARQAASRYALEDAEAAFRLAIELSERPSLEAAEDRLALARLVLSRTGRHREAVTLVEEAVDDADALRHGPTRARARIDLSSYLLILGRYDDARARANEGMEIAYEQGLPALRADGYANLASLHVRSGDLEDALAACSSGLACLEHTPGDDEVARRLRGIQAVALWHMGRSARAVEVGRVLHKHAVAKGTRHDVARADHYLGLFLADHGDHEASYRHQRRAAKAFDEIGDRRMSAISRTNLAGIAYHAGRLEEAAVEIRAASAVLRELGNEREAALGDLNLASIYMELGRLIEAGAVYQRVLDSLEALGEGQAWRALTGLATIERRTGGSPEAVEALLQRALDTTPEGSWGPMLLAVCVERVHLAIAKGGSTVEALTDLERAVTDIGEVPEHLTGLIEDARVAARDRGGQ